MGVQSNFQSIKLRRSNKTALQNDYTNQKDPPDFPPFVPNRQRVLLEGGGASNSDIAAEIKQLFFFFLIPELFNTDDSTRFNARQYNT